MTTINLNKDNAGPGNGAKLDNVTHLDFGASWDTTTRGKGGWLGKLTNRAGLDIDLIGILMQGKTPVKYVGLDNLNPVGGAVVHSGDEKTGKKANDDEAIKVKLLELDLAYTAIFFTASVFKMGAVMKGVEQGMRESDPERAAEIFDQGFQGAKNVEFTVYLAGADGPETIKIMPDLAGKENCCLIAKVSRTSLTDPTAPWQIEIFSEMVTIKKDSMPSLLDHCRTR